MINITHLNTRYDLGLEQAGRCRRAAHARLAEDTAAATNIDAARSRIVEASSASEFATMYTAQMRLAAAS